MIFELRGYTLVINLLYLYPLLFKSLDQFMEVLTRPMSKDEEIIKKVLDTWVSRNGYSEVQANIEGYDTPSGMSNMENEDLLVPDIMAKKRSGRWYIEVVKKDGDAERTVSKWKLLSILGKNKGGGLILIAPSGNFAFADRLTKKHDINVKIVKFS